MQVTAKGELGLGSGLVFGLGLELGLWLRLPPSEGARKKKQLSQPCSTPLEFVSFTIDTS